MSVSHLGIAIANFALTVKYRYVPVIVERFNMKFESEEEYIDYMKYGPGADKRATERNHAVSFIDFIAQELGLNPRTATNPEILAALRAANPARVQELTRLKQKVKNQRKELKALNKAVGFHKLLVLREAEVARNWYRLYQEAMKRFNELNENR